MANSNSFFAFLAGAVTGAALLLLANTDKGVEVMEDIKEKGSEALNDGRAAVLNGLDKLENGRNSKPRRTRKKRRPSNMAKENSALGVLAGETRDYVNLAIDEVKLKTTRGLSTALGQILSWLIIIAVLSLVLGLLSLALLQWINGLVGSPWGTLIVAAVFGLALLILFLNRQKLFRNMFVKLFIDVFYDTDDDEQ